MVVLPESTGRSKASQQHIALTKALTLQTTETVSLLQQLYGR
jgi:hypothetical protein